MIEDTVGDGFCAPSNRSTFGFTRVCREIQIPVRMGCETIEITQALHRFQSSHQRAQTKNLVQWSLLDEHGFVRQRIAGRLYLHNLHLIEPRRILALRMPGLAFCQIRALWGVRVNVHRYQHLGALVWV